MTTITVSQFDRLNAALSDAKRIAAESARIEREDRATRATLLELFLEIGLDNKSVPGLTTAVTTDVKFNEKAAFDWAMADENYLHAAAIVSVKPVATGSVLALFKDDPKRAGLFELNKSGYKKAVREGHFVGIPFDGIVETIGVKLKEDDIQFGPALLGKFDIVPDDEAEGRKGIAEMEEAAAELKEHSVSSVDYSTPLMRNTIAAHAKETGQSVDEINASLGLRSEAEEAELQRKHEAVLAGLANGEAV